MSINPWARLLFWFIVLLLFAFFGSLAHAVELGVTSEMGISICLEKKEAIAIIDAERLGSKEDADTLFAKSEKCTNLHLIFKPQKLVYLATTKRGDVKIVEIEVGEYKAYWITFMPIKSIRTI